MTLDTATCTLGTLKPQTIFCYDGGLYEVADRAGETVEAYKVADYNDTGTPTRLFGEPVGLSADLVVEERKPSGDPLEMFGLDCWGWQTKVAAYDADDARVRAIAADPDGLYAEMAEMANVKPLGQIPAASHVHQL